MKQKKNIFLMYAMHQKKDDFVIITIKNGISSKTKTKSFYFYFEGIK